MELIRLEASEPRRWPSPAVAVGNFDGVHRGHQALVRAAVDEARAMAGTAVVLTFEPHPARVLNPERAPATLMTLEQKTEVLSTLGIDRLAVLPFTRELAQEPPEQFARDVLARGLGARVVAVGANFRFGHHRQGDAPGLARLGEALGFRLRVIEPVVHQGAPISSTRVREAVESGEVGEARELLGRSFFVEGRVVAGEGRGRALGAPTANLELVNETLPGRGVYACRCRVLEDERLVVPAAVNVGRRPTFAGDATTVEAHLLGFQGNLYGRRLRLEFEQRLREERRFEGPDALREQIQRDIERVREVLREP